MTDPLSVERVVRPAFSVMGKEGGSDDGDGFIARLWAEANAGFSEVAPLAVTETGGTPAGVWGLMTDYGRRFLPWENNFTRGLYLAGVECTDDAVPPCGWVKWTVPGFDFLRTENNAPDTFSRMLAYLAANDIPLAGAVHEMTHPASGKSYLYFPVERL